MNINKNKFKKIFCITPLVLSFGLSSCSSVKIENIDALYDKNYMISSNESSEISKITVSINFEYYTYANNLDSINLNKHSGTAWIYHNGTNDYYYLATNLHVANILSFANKTMQSYDSEKDQFTSINYGEIVSSSIMFVSPRILNDIEDQKKENYYVENNLLSTVYTNIPKIIYTTVNDSEYNQVFNSKYYSKNGNSYSGVTDIAILQYYLPKNKDYYVNNLLQRNTLTGQSTSFNETDYSDFEQWISQTKEIVVFKEVLSDNTAYNNKFYMGGFPSKTLSTQNPNSISWQSFSDFNANSLITKQFQYPWNIYNENENLNTHPTPIAFFGDKSNINDENTYNFLSVGKEIFFYAKSYPGASGSPIVTKINNKLQIVGIYWGTVKFQINGTNRELGVANLFANNNAGKKFNITTNIDKKIQQENQKLSDMVLYNK